MKKNSLRKKPCIVKRISITDIGIFIIACILGIDGNFKAECGVPYDRDAQMMKFTFPIP